MCATASYSTCNTMLEYMQHNVGVRATHIALYTYLEYRRFQRGRDGGTKILKQQITLRDFLKVSFNKMLAGSEQVSEISG